MMKLPQIPTPKNPEKGFTLIELMIVIAIIAILVAIALPAYQTYIRKAKLTEVVNATQAAKTGITAYVQEKENLSGFNATGFDQTTAVGNVTSIDVEAASDTSATICVTGASGLTGGTKVERVVLTGTVADGNVTWVCQSSAEQKHLPASCASATIAACP